MSAMLTDKHVLYLLKIPSDDELQDILDLPKDILSINCLEYFDYIITHNIFLCASTVPLIKFDLMS